MEQIQNDQVLSASKVYQAFLDNRITEFVKTVVFNEEKLYLSHDSRWAYENEPRLLIFLKKFNYHLESISIFQYPKTKKTFMAYCFHKNLVEKKSNVEEGNDPKNSL